MNAIGRPKPRHLGPVYASQFSDPSVVAAYQHRPPYPFEVISFLVNLAARPRGLLDIGCGRGDLTLPLARHFERVDAVDPSVPMLDEAQRLAGSQVSCIRWLCSTLAQAPIEGPYDLITAGESLHWTDWSVVFPRLASVLAPGALLAIVTRRFDEPPWNAELHDLLDRYSTNRDYEPYDLLEELIARDLYRPEGSYESPVVGLSGRLEEYKESFHSANGFSRDRMTPSEAEAFDEALSSLVLEHRSDGVVELNYHVRVDYGRPLDTR